VDIYPTLAELAKLPMPTHVQGKSFVPVLENPDQKWKEVAALRYLPDLVKQQKGKQLE
jgi:arylsulfatase A-like enzyme